MADCGEVVLAVIPKTPAGGLQALVLTLPYNHSGDHLVPRAVEFLGQVFHFVSDLRERWKSYKVELKNLKTAWFQTRIVGD